MLFQTCMTVFFLWNTKGCLNILDLMKAHEDWQCQASNMKIAIILWKIDSWLFKKDVICKNFYVFLKL